MTYERRPTTRVVTFKKPKTQVSLKQAEKEELQEGEITLKEN